MPRRTGAPDFKQKVDVNMRPTKLPKTRLNKGVLQKWKSMISGVEVSEPGKTGWLAASLHKEVLKSITSMTFNRVEHMRFRKWEPQ